MSPRSLYSLAFFIFGGVRMTKYIFVTGGAVSGPGRGVTAALKRNGTAEEEN